MFGVVENRVFTSGQEWRRERDIVEGARAGFGCKIHFESRGSEHFERMQRAAPLGDEVFATAIADFVPSLPGSGAILWMAA